MKRSAFHVRVADESSGKLDADFCRYLREPDNLNKWHSALVDLRQDIEQQVTERRVKLDDEHTRCLALGDPGKLIYFEIKNEFEKWRQGAGRFKGGLDQRLREVKTLRRERAESQSEDETWAVLKLAAQLIPKDGIGAHWHKRFDELKK